MVNPRKHQTGGLRATRLSLQVRRGEGTRNLLEDVSLAIPHGTFAAVVGSSGSGKSTLLKLLAGISDASSGEVVLGGHRVEALNAEWPLAVGYLPQAGAFNPELTVRESLELAARLRLPRSVSRAMRREWIEHIAEFSGLEPILGQRYRTLSGGQMRRLALGEALIGDPAFLFLDELTSGLDAFSDQEMMLWLRDMAHNLGKTVVLVTHATYHLHLCDAVAFLHGGRLAYLGSYDSLLEAHGVESMTDVFALYQRGGGVAYFRQGSEEEEASGEPQPLKTAKPPNGFEQFPVLLGRQLKLFWRDRGQLWLHLALIVTFPAIVAVFATKGLPQVRNLTLALETNVVRSLHEQLLYFGESFKAAALISGLAMFQVVLLTLIGANNGAREIAREGDVLEKELRAGLSAGAYIASKMIQIVGLCFVQAFWMSWFVKVVCGFPGELVAQFAILFATTLAMSVICLGISAASPSPERASLLAIYLVGFQLPLSGAALSLPDWLSTICRPFIAAYWGWSGYLQTFSTTRHYDIVKQSTSTEIAPYGLCVAMLGLHVLVGLGVAWYFTRRRTLA